MSFEGYYQCICEAGHYYEAAYDYDGSGIEACDTCQDAGILMPLAVWTHRVDETNGDDYGCIDERLLKVFTTIPADFSRTRWAPTPEEERRLQRYRITDENGESAWKFVYGKETVK